MEALAPRLRSLLKGLAPRHPDRFWADLPEEEAARDFVVPEEDAFRWLRRGDRPSPCGYIYFALRLGRSTALGDVERMVAAWRADPAYGEEESTAATASVLHAEEGFLLYCLRTANKRAETAAAVVRRAAARTGCDLLGLWLRQEARRTPVTRVQRREVVKESFAKRERGLGLAEEKGEWALPGALSRI